MGASFLGVCMTLESCSSGVGGHPDNGCQVESPAKSGGRCVLLEH